MSRISISLARQLKDAGLQWQPALHDEFGIPDRGLDDRTFVISDLLSTIQTIRGTPMVSFHGSLEWALDTLVTSEVIWMPSETQLRDMLEDHLAIQDNPEASLILRRTAGGYVCEIALLDEVLFFEGEHASEAYGRALMNFLSNN